MNKAEAMKAFARKKSTNN